MTPEEFDRNVKLHLRSLMTIARRWTRAHEQDAEDLVAETLLLAWRAIGAYRNDRPHSFRAFLRLKLRSAAQQQRVKEQARRRLPRMVSLEWTGESGERTAHPLALAHHQQITRQTADVFADMQEIRLRLRAVSLTPLQRAVFALLLEDRTQAEAAQALGLTKQQVNYLLKKGQRVLQAVGLEQIHTSEPGLNAERLFVACSVVSVYHPPAR